MATAFIIGGAGQIGIAMAAALLDQGWQVTLGSRARRPLPPSLLDRGVRAATFDRDESGALGQALGAGVDLLIDTIAYDAGHADQLLGVQDAVGAFIVVSSASVYRDAQGRSLDTASGIGFPELPVPITEAQPTVEAGPTTYSTRKVALERRLLDQAHAPVTILRPCAIHGLHSVKPREWWFVKRLLDGRTRIPLAYAGQSRFHTSAVANIAALTIAVAGRRATQVLNAVDPQAPTATEIGAAIMAALGRQAELVPVGPPGDQTELGKTPWSGAKPFVVSDAAARATGYTPVVGYADGVAPACRWLVEIAAGRDWRALFPALAGIPGDPFDYALEDAWLAEH